MKLEEYLDNEGIKYTLGNGFFYGYRESCDIGDKCMGSMGQMYENRKGKVVIVGEVSVRLHEKSCYNSTGAIEHIKDIIEANSSISRDLE
ncbi:hypothetical protein ACFL1H_01710 [Nanoarchaeota archaeon]